jgi:hypothetical protein
MAAAKGHWSKGKFYTRAEINARPALKKRIQKEMAAKRGSKKRAAKKRATRALPPAERRRRLEQQRQRAQAFLRNRGLA